MRYELMFPDQIRQAIDENWPVIWPVGVLEYHAEHCVTGVDTLVVTKAVDELEKEMDIVVMPVFYYGSSSYAVDLPERNGSVHLDSSIVHQFARGVFAAWLRIGFRNIHAFVHHQSENFKEGMPTDLALRFAARQTTFEFLEKNRGENWWGDESMQDYYNSKGESDNPFNWIRIHPFMDEESQKRYPIDHAGKQETSLMMAFCPEGVDMKKFDPSKWYAKSASDATLAYGNEAKKMILDGIRKAIRN